MHALPDHNPFACRYCFAVPCLGSTACSAASATQESSSTSKHNSKIPPFLILGTVFNEHALASPALR